MRARAADQPALFVLDLIIRSGRPRRRRRQWRPTCATRARRPSSPRPTGQRLAAGDARHRRVQLAAREASWFCFAELQVRNKLLLCKSQPQIARRALADPSAAAANQTTRPDETSVAAADGELLCDLLSERKTNCVSHLLQKPASAVTSCVRLPHNFRPNSSASPPPPRAKKRLKKSALDVMKRPAD